MHNNFIPKSDFSRASLVYRLRAGTIFALLSSGAFLAGGLVLLPILQVLPKEEQYARAEILEAQKQIETDNLSFVEEEVGALNQLLSSTDSLFVSRLSPSGALARVLAHTPSGVSVRGMSLQDSKVELSGTAITRDQFLLFVEELRADRELVSNVLSPVGNVITPKNSNFSIILELSSPK